MTDESLLFTLLEEDRADTVVEADGKVYKIEPQITVDFDGSVFEEKISGYRAVSCGKEYGCADFKELLKLVRKNGDVKIVSAGGFASLEEYLADKKFKTIGMAELLEKYLPSADEFSLTAPFNEYDGEHPYGIYRVGEREAAAAAAKLSEYTKKTALAAYGRLTEGQKRQLPPFERLYAEVKEEYSKYAAGRAEFMEANGGSVFFGDEFAKGNAKYSKFKELWHMYEAVDFEGTCLFCLGKMRQNIKIRPDDYELGLECYAPLKGAHRRTEVGFVWHCTASGRLAKTMYFSLNGGSIGWLKALKDDYDMGILEDLAFYKEGKCIFSSCTHERYHTDLS